MVSPLSRLRAKAQFASQLDIAAGRSAADNDDRSTAIGDILDSLERSGTSWFWATDRLGKLTYASESALAILSQWRDAPLGSDVSNLLFDGNTQIHETGERTLRFLFASRCSISQKTVRVGGENSHIWWEIAGVPEYDSNRRFVGYRGFARDVSRTHEARRKAERMSQYDALTGLANRYRMSQQLAAVLSTFIPSNRCCALMMLDLDRFKQVNDTLGHPAGDELLKQVAARITRIVGDRCEIGRLGGDEFQIILPDIDQISVLKELAERMIDLVSQPYSVNGSRAIIGTSIGIAMAPNHGTDSEELVKAADLALYAAKGAGRGQHQFYSSDLRASANHRHQLETDLRDAIPKNELQMHFQPIVCAGSHHVECMEALMRWDHGERGKIPPGDFIPVAEEVGLIRELGEWALRDVCRKVSNWPHSIKAAVNVSAVQFSSDDFVEIVRRALATTGVNPAQIELEITESVFVGDFARSLELFRKLKALGVSLSLDDFGTGYSSLSYLRDAPFDKIKIDQSFVRGCSVRNSNNSAIISAVVSLAAQLGMATVAEGVEVHEDLEHVTNLGVTHLQGVLFSRALPNEEVQDRLELGQLKYSPEGPRRYRAERRTEFRRIRLFHGDHDYHVFLRNLSSTGAKIEGLLEVPIGTQVVLELAQGQLAVATVRRSEGSSQGLEFEVPLVPDTDLGLRTPNLVSAEELGAALGQEKSSDTEGRATLSLLSTKAFAEVDLGWREE
jgi:diguanylate cyclase (GGDEF)-like protein